ncbi:hypothetical protein [Aureivirga sp. CE67]|uniref:hypothetical protein n=1 Tax=Aureivirga sp. CE67 TaxID=1788983 RepID=UPI0018CB99E7|nr:hypothetical protein [Aureivirga sp. CE67]
MKIYLKYLFGLNFLILVSCNENKSNLCDLTNFENNKNYEELYLNLNITYDDFGPLNKCAKEQNKPILTIYGCYACLGDRNVIWGTLAHKELKKNLQEKFLIRYYHVDSRTPLPDSIQEKTNFKTIGKYFSAKQIIKYQNNSQPFFTITDWKESDLTEPIGYVSKNEYLKFKQFLEDGLRKFND